MKALVVGASGWLGSRVLAALNRDGIEAVAFCHGSPGDADAARGDLLDPEELFRIVERQRPDAVIHAAGFTVSDAGWGRLYRLHVEGTANLLGAIQAGASGAHLIALGSAAEYGTSTSSAPIAEGEPCSPSGHYGLSKLMQTELELSAARWNGLAVTVLRLFNPIGAGMPPGLMLSDLFGRLKQLRAGGGGTLEVFDLQAVRDFVPVEAVAETVVRAVRRRGPFGILNVATGEGTSVGRVVEWLREASDFEWTVQPGFAEGRRSGGGRSVGDPTAQLRELGPIPRASARDAVVAAFRADVLEVETVA